MNYVEIISKQPSTMQIQFSDSGYDACVLLGNGLSKSIRIKCGTKDNFLKFGKPLRSFTLGPFNDVTASNFVTTPIAHYDLLLTGYEIEKDILCPYVLIYWPVFIRKIYKKKDKIVSEIDAFGNRFAWIKYDDIPVSCVCAMDLNGF